MKDPHFHPVHADPLNGAPAPALLATAHATPASAFFVRNHGRVPALSGAQHLVRIDGLVRNPLTLSVAQLQALPQQQLEALIACAGNRRSELAALQPVPGELPWEHTALSNALWGGVSLAELLRLVQPLPEARHVCFEGADVATDGGGTGHLFGGSVPLEHAEQALLALTMHGAPLPPEHGAPVRVLVPGYIGARSVKWLTSITLSAEPSQNHYQAKTYRLYPPTVTDRHADPALGEALGPLRVNSAFLTPPSGAELAAGPVTLRGWAHASFGQRLLRVELSADAGATWQEAALTRGGSDSAWVLWDCVLQLPAGAHTLCCRATDTAGAQPSALGPQWNVKGYMASAWHRVTVGVSAG